MEVVLMEPVFATSKDRLKRDAQHGCTGEKRNWRVTISGRHAMFADVINRIILAILDVLS